MLEIDVNKRYKRVPVDMTMTAAVLEEKRKIIKIAVKDMCCKLSRSISVLNDGITFSVLPDDLVTVGWKDA